MRARELYTMVDTSHRGWLISSHLSRWPCLFKIMDTSQYLSSQYVSGYSVDQKFFTFRDFLQINSITSILGRAVLKYSDIALRICTIVA